MRRFPPVALVGALALVGACSSVVTLPPTPTSSADTEQAVGPPLFEDITKASGIDFTYRNGEEPNHLAILESLGGGVGLIDFNGDGKLDVFLPGGGEYAGPDKKQIVGRPCRLYENLGGNKFRDATAAAGLDKLAGGKPWFYTHAAAVGDYDRDGKPDLLVTGWGAVALFRNLGGKFEDATAKAGLDQGITWATSAAFADLDGDGHPDLYVCQYVDWSWAKHPSCTYDGKTPDVCPPKNFSGLRHKLYHNTGQGAFRDVTDEAGIKAGGPSESKGLGVLVLDVTGDGKPDIYVANDTVDNFLYANKSTPGKIRLDEVGALSMAARDDRGSANGSMGLDAGDPERTGKPHVWVTNYENELHAMYATDMRGDKPFFNFRTAGMGIAAIGQKYVGWGTAFLDADLDGWEDLYVANGHAIRYPTGKDVGRKQKPVLLLNRQGKYVEASKRIGAYSEAPRLGRGVGFGDLDNDGRVDLVVCHTNEPVAVLRGTGGAGHHWLGVELHGQGHADVVGARVTFEAAGQKPQARFAKGGGSYCSAGDRRVVFGLGAEAKGRVTVKWPDGKSETFDDLAADKYYRVVQGSGKAEPVAGN